ncbi:MAG: flippase-like domain-containing protein [Candidatus Diapherotrites archaeon]|nr:flippase-like domain-containing protein [Candidatus Diapherotrites archaeon]
MLSKIKWTFVLLVLWLLLMQGLATIYSENIFLGIFKFPLWAVAVTFICYILMTLFTFIAFVLCARHASVKLKLRELIQSFLFGDFVDNVTPIVAPAGAVAVAVHMNKVFKIDYSKAFTTVALYWSSLLLGNIFFGLAAFAIISTAITIPVMYQDIFLGVLGMFFIAGILVVFALKSKRLMMWLYKIVVKVKSKFTKVEQKMKSYREKEKEEEFKKFYKPVDVFFQNKRIVLISGIIQMAPGFLATISIWALMQSLGVPVMFEQVLFVNAISWYIANAIVFIPSGIGIYETSTTQLFALFGFAAAPAVLSIVLFRLIFVWITNLIGFLIGLKAGLSANDGQ